MLVKTGIFIHINYTHTTQSPHPYFRGACRRCADMVKKCWKLLGNLTRTTCGIFWKKNEGKLGGKW